MRTALRMTTLTLIGLALGAVSAATAARAEDESRARKMMEDAFNRRYRWAEDFQGFSADFTYTKEGKAVKGSLRADVTKPHGVVEVTCDDEAVKKLVRETVASTITHTRASRFDKGFGSCSFAIAGDGAQGGTRIAVSGHGFFKDFTVKDGQIVENHGGHGDMSSEVKVRQVVWMADSGKTLPREYAFTIKTGDHEQTGRTVETWREFDGVWLPTWYHMTRSEGSTPVESMLRLENVRLETPRRS